MDYMSAPAIATAYVIHMVLGALWYSKAMFGKQFLQLAHPQLVKKGEEPKMSSEAMASCLLGSAMCIPVVCFLFQVVQPSSPSEGSIWGACLALLLNGGLNVSHNLFEKRPFALFVMHTGYHAISLMCIGLVLVAVFGRGK